MNLHGELEHCLICGVELPKWEAIFCCNDSVGCDCRGLPINEPICDRCSYRDVNEEE